MKYHWLILLLSLLSTIDVLAQKTNELSAYSLEELSKQTASAIERGEKKQVKSYIDEAFKRFKAPPNLNDTISFKFWIYWVNNNLSSHSNERLIKVCDSLITFSLSRQGTNRISTADLYSLKGAVYIKAYRLDTAIYYLKKAIAIHKNYPDSFKKAYVLTLIRLGVAYKRSGKFNAAEESFKSAVATCNKYLDKGDYITLSAQHWLGSFYITLRMYAKALDLILDVRNRIEDRASKRYQSLYKSTFVGIADCYNLLGSSNLALTELNNLRALYVNNASTKDMTYLGGLTTQASILIDQRKYKQAREVLDLLYREMIVVLPDRKMYLSSVYNLIGDTYLNEKEYSRSVYYYQRALNILKDSGLGENLDYTRIQMYIGDAYIRLGELDKALTVLDSAYVRDKRDTEFAFSSMTIKISTLIAGIHLSKGNVAAAQRFLQPMIDTFIVRDTLVNGDITLKPIFFAKSVCSRSEPILDFIFVWMNSALQEEGIDKNKELNIRWDFYYNLIQKYINETEVYKRKVSFWNKENKGLEFYLNKGPDIDNKTTYNLSERAKSILLRAATPSVEIRNISNISDSTELVYSRHYQKKSSLYANILSTKNGKDLISLRSEQKRNDEVIDSLKKKLMETNSEYFSLSRNDDVVDIGRLQQYLPASTAILEYVVTDTIIHLIKVTKDSFTVFKQTVDEKSLDRNIKKYRRLLSSIDADFNNKDVLYEQYQRLGYWLYSKLIQPVIGNDTSIRRLVIIPDGNLGLIPFETFITSSHTSLDKSFSFKDLPYLIKSYSVSYNYSASLWLKQEEKQQRRNSKGILGVGLDHVYYCGNSAAMMSEGFHPGMKNRLKLPAGVTTELDIMQENYVGDYLYNNEATEQKIKNQAINYNVVHFATHGVFNTTYGVLSGLMLAADKDSLEDGFFQAYEVAQTNFNADLVVLSGCETGITDFETGNGIASLARSFMYANTPSLVATLWRTKSGATTDIMAVFYEKLSDGLPKDIALQQAKIEYMNNNPKGHLSDWATFIQIGNRAPLHIQKRIKLASYMRVFFVLWCMFCLVAGIWYWKR